VHVFVSEKVDGNTLFGWLSPRYDCRLVTSENSREEVNRVAEQWAGSKFEVLISTSIALVGNENPRCRHLVCAGYLYDNMQMVQAIGRLRPYMRTPIGHVFVSVPKDMPDYRHLEDQKRFTVLKNQKFLVDDDYTRFKFTMTSGGVREWCIDASTGQNGCALKILSVGFGTRREDCMACLFCRSSGSRRTQDEALQRSQKETENSQSAERVLHKLALVCLVCRRVDCCGFPFLKGEGSQLLPENRFCCFDWKMCFKCGVSAHDRRSHCFDKAYLKNIACCECWVFKNVSGARRHERTECDVKGRLRRLLSHNYLQRKKKETYKDYIEAIYTSKESFCEFLSTVEKTYMKK
jgi:hypothetical protein